MRIIVRSSLLTLLALCGLGVAAVGTTSLRSASVTDTQGTQGTGGTQGTAGTQGTQGTTGTNGTTGTTATTQPTSDEFFRQARQLIEAANAKPTPTKIKCSWRTGTCSATDLYVNGDAISVVQIADLPASTTTTAHVAVTAGESFEDPTLSVNEKDFTPLPSDISVAVHVNRSLFPTFTSRKHRFFGTAGAMREVYTVDRLVRRLQQAAADRIEATSAIKTATTADGAKLATAANARADQELKQAAAAQEDFLSLITAGQSPLMLVRVNIGNDSKSFPVGLVYQRWYFDTGGFFAFMKARDEELVTTSADNNEVKVLQRRRTGNAGTATGVSFNVHPGNYPEVGLQFGLVNNTDRAPSYFLGGTGRLRSIGHTALISFALGYAESQVKTFPGVATGQPYPVGYPLLNGHTRYTARPYAAIGVSINLSGVSQGSAVTPPTTATTGT